MQNALESDCVSGYKKLISFLLVNCMMLLSPSAVFSAFILLIIIFKILTLINNFP